MAAKQTISTEAQLQALLVKPTTYEVPVICQETGLVIRVSKRQKTFRWNRGKGYTPRVCTYGSYPQLSFADAVAVHVKAKANHRAGLPLTHEVGVPRTVNGLADKFMEVIRRRREWPEDVALTLDKEVRPAIGHVALAQVTPMAVAAIITGMVQRGAPGRAGKVLAQTKQMFKFAEAMGWVDRNPAYSLSPADLGVVTKTRDRTLSPADIRAFRQALDAAPAMWTQVKAGVWLLLLTGLRSGELRRARWEDIDREAHTLTIPPVHQKLTRAARLKAKPFVVPLSTQAVVALAELRSLDPVWIFPGRAPNSSLQEGAMKYGVHRLFEFQDTPLENTERFSPHDLRRTLRTGLGELRVPPHVAEKCLNHSLGKLEDVYDQGSYLTERREALQKWADLVDSYIGTGGSFL